VPADAVALHRAQGQVRQWQRRKAVPDDHIQRDVTAHGPDQVGVIEVAEHPDR
jgi:hypothetical protein